MSKREGCYGCDGKGWVQIVHSERTMPWQDPITRKPTEGFAMQIREYAPVKCPICRGSGAVAAGAQIVPALAAD